MPGLGGAWRSLVAHLLWEQGVGGSNPLAPTAKLTGPRREPRGCSSTVEPQPSKLVMGVRFPSPALAHPARSKAAAIGPFADRVQINAIVAFEEKHKNRSGIISAAQAHYAEIANRHTER